MVKRYAMYPTNDRDVYEEEHETGPWVKYEDYDALAARLAEAERVIHLVRTSSPGWSAAIDSYRAADSAEAARYAAHVEMERQAREASDENGA
jgi:hypothetical protein